MIVFLTGASGVGKTSIVEKLEQDHSTSGIQCFHFDSIGIPEIEEMNAVEDWQKNTTHEWIDRLIAADNKDIIIFEGSTNIHFILSGFKKHDYHDYLIILIDCTEEVMMKRLIENRQQPELVSQDMKNWLQYLRRQANELSMDRIDTTHSSLDDCVDLLLEKIKFVQKRNSL